MPRAAPPAPMMAIFMPAPSLGRDVAHAEACAHVSLQGERYQGVARGDRHMLLAVAQVADGIRDDHTAGREVPEVLAGSRVQGEEIPFDSAAENDVPGGRKQPSPRRTHEPVFPFHLAGLWRDGADGPVAWIVGNRLAASAGEARARLVDGFGLKKDIALLLGRHVVES